MSWAKDSYCSFPPATPRIGENPDLASGFGLSNDQSTENPKRLNCATRKAAENVLVASEKPGFLVCPACHHILGFVSAQGNLRCTSAVEAGMRYLFRCQCAKEAWLLAVPELCFKRIKKIVLAIPVLV